MAGGPAEEDRGAGRGRAGGRTPPPDTSAKHTGDPSQLGVLGTPTGPAAAGSCRDGPDLARQPIPSGSPRGQGVLRAALLPKRSGKG